MSEAAEDGRKEHPGEVLLKERGCVIKRSDLAIRLEFDQEFQTDDVYEYLTRVLQEQKES